MCKKRKQFIPLVILGEAVIISVDETGQVKEYKQTKQELNNTDLHIEENK